MALGSNRSGEMEVFVRVVELGGFSAAARASHISPSAVSKLVARLEGRLHARLFSRSTRKLRLTAEGEAYYNRALNILEALDEADKAAGAGEQPSGVVRISSSASYFTHILAPILPDFLSDYPEIQLDIGLTDAVVDLLAERTDVAIRAGDLPSSALVARKLGETRMMIVAAPGWVSAHGIPRTPAELRKHDLIGFSYARAVKGWPLMENGRQTQVQAAGRIQVSDGEGIRRLALAGAGPARLSHFTIAQDLAEGRLLPLLEEHNPGDMEAFHAVFIGQSGLLPARARVLLDFLAERGRVT